MRFKFVGGIGVPRGNRIVYDRSHKMLRTIFKSEQDYGSLFSVCTTDLSISLHFGVDDGVFVGLSCSSVDLNALPRKDLEIFYASDGEVRVDCNLHNIITGCTYFGFDGVASYDESKNSVLFGKISHSGAVFRVIDNAYISLSSDGNLCGVLIKL